MNRISLIVAVCGIVAPAFAQRNAIDIKVRTAGDTVWHDWCGLYLSKPEHVEVAVFYERASGYGFASVIHNIVMTNWGSSTTVQLLDRPDSTLHPDGRQGRFNFGSQAQAAYSTGADAGSLRIAAANNTQNASAGGIAVRQSNPVASGTLFDSGNLVMGFRFDLFFQPPHGHSTWFLSTPANRVNTFSVFESATSTTATNLPLSSVELDGAVITFIPAPTTFVTLAAGFALHARRRKPRSLTGVPR